MNYNVDFKYQPPDFGCGECGAARGATGLIPLDVPSHKETTCASVVVLACLSCGARHLRLQVNTLRASEVDADMRVLLHEDLPLSPDETIVGSVVWEDGLQCAVQETQLGKAVLHRLRFPAATPMDSERSDRDCAHDLLECLWLPVLETREIDLTTEFRSRPEVIARRRRMN
jgi:hypothetical protein